MATEDLKCKLRGILSADVVGYSRLLRENEASAIRNLEENKKLIFKLAEEFEGSVVDAPGDNILAEFSLDYYLNPNDADDFYWKLDIGSVGVQ